MPTSRGILHRDLKPANILLQFSNGKLLPGSQTFEGVKTPDVLRSKADSKLAEASGRSDSGRPRSRLAEEFTLDDLHAAVPMVADFGLAKQVEKRRRLDPVRHDRRHA